MNYRLCAEFCRACFTHITWLMYLCAERREVQAGRAVVKKRAREITGSLVCSFKKLVYSSIAARMACSSQLSRQVQRHFERGFALSIFLEKWPFGGFV